MTALVRFMPFLLLAVAVEGRMYRKNGHIYKTTWNQAVLNQITEDGPICCAGLCNMKKEHCNSFHYNTTSNICSLANLTKLEDVIIAENGIDVFMDLEFLKHLVSECPADKPYPFDNRSKCCEENLEENYSSKFPGVLTQKSKSCSGTSVACISGICRRSKTVETVNPFHVLDFDLIGDNVIEVSRTSKSSADECRIECDKAGNCEGWTYNQVNTRCYVKMFNNARSYFHRLESQDEATSGYKQSFAGLTQDEF